MGKYDWMEMMENMQEIRHFSSLHIRGKREGATSPQEVDMLSRVMFSDVSLTPLGLAALTGLSKSAISRLVDNLEKKGFLEKKYSEKDKRSYTLYLTTEGELEMKKAYHHYLDPIYRLRRTIGEERFYSLMAQIKEANNILQSKEADR